MPFLNKRRKYASKKRAAPRRKRVFKNSKSFVKKVESIIHKQVETKQASRTLPLTAFNSAADTSSDIYPIFPLVTQDATEAGRNGDQIRAQKMVLKGHIIQTINGAASYSRIAVRMLICQPKLFTNLPSISANANNWLPYVLRQGNISSGLDGTIASLYSPVDTSIITCYYDKVTYISMPVMVTSAGQQEMRNSVKFFSKTFNLKNKLLQYNSNYQLNTSPTNYSPVCLLSYVFLDGTAPSTLFTNVSMSWTNTLYYEDA